MGALVVIILVAILLTALLYRGLYRVSPFRNFTRQLTPVQRVLGWFVVLYVPVQVFVLLMAGHHLPVANPKGHEVFAVFFTASHAILSVMGMVMSMYFYHRNRKAIVLLILNSGTAIFYLMSCIIFAQQLIK